jgi:hypothetical protein
MTIRGQGDNGRNFEKENPFQVSSTQSINRTGALLGN